MVTAVRPSEQEIKRRQHLLSELKSRQLTVQEAEELQAILYKELHYSQATGEIGLLAYFALHGLISYLGYCLKMEVLDSGSCG